MGESTMNLLTNVTVPCMQCKDGTLVAIVCEAQFSEAGNNFAALRYKCNSCGKELAAQIQGDAVAALIVDMYESIMPRDLASLGDDGKELALHLHESGHKNFAFDKLPTDMRPEVVVVIDCPCGGTKTHSMDEHGVVAIVCDHCRRGVEGKDFIAACKAWNAGIEAENE